MSRTPRLFRATTFGSLCAAIACALLVQQQTSADVGAVLIARDINEKGLALVKLRRTLSAEDMVELARKEKESFIVELALGNYLEAGSTDDREVAGVVALCAARKDMFDTTGAILAVNKQMIDVVKLYTAGGREDTPKTRLLAALILAQYGRMLDVPRPQFPAWEMEAGAAPAGANDKKKKAAAARFAVSALPKVLDEDVAAVIKKLLEEKDDTTQELTLLAAAMLRVKGAQAAVEGLNLARSPEAEAVRLLYLARIGQALDADKLAAIFRKPDKPNRLFVKLSPMMSHYDPRSSPWGYACEAIGAAPAPANAAHVDYLHKALTTSNDLRVQIDAAKAIEQVGSPLSVAPLVKVLGDCDWPVRVAVVSALGAIPSTDAITPLIDRLSKEQGRFRLDINYALASITNGQKATDSDGWRAWWTNNEAAFKVDPKVTAAYRKANRPQDMNVVPLGSFYDTAIFSDRFAYVLDTSASMKGEKIKSLKENLAQSVKDLKPYVQFNVVDFGGHVSVMFPNRLLPVAQVKGDTLRSVEYMDLTLGTRTYDGMESAYRLPGIDTIVFLSDGAPVASKVNDWARIMFITHLFNRYRPIAVYTVEFEASGRNLAAMREMAARFSGISGKPQQ